MSEISRAHGLRCEIVKSGNGEACPAHRHDFSFPGGTLGRSHDNDLVLPDQRKEIASLQAIIHIGNSGQHQICNRGGMPIRLNGVSVERGQQRPINGGDRLEIGAFVLQFSELTPADADCTHEAAVESKRGDNVIPGEIWAALDAEFVAANTEPRPPAASDPQHPLLQAKAIRSGPDNPLILRGGDGDLGEAESGADMSRLFTQDHPLMQTPIMADTTPTVLASPAQSMPPSATYRRASLVLDTPHPFVNGYEGALIDRPAVAEPNFDTSETPLSLLLSTAIPLAAVCDDADLGSGADASSAPTPAATGQPQTQSAPPPVNDTPDQLHLGMDTRPVEPMAIPELLALQHAMEVKSAMPVSPESSDSAQRREPAVSESSRIAPQPATSATKKIRDPYDPASIVPAPSESLANELSSPPAPGHSPNHEPAESMPSPLARAFLEGLGLNPAAHVQFGCEQLHLAGRLLRSFSDGMVKLLASHQTQPPDAEREAATANDEKQNPFFALPSGNRVAIALFQQPLPEFANPEDAIERAFDHITVCLSQMASAANAPVDAVLQRLSPEQLELEITAAGLRMASEKTRQAALWEYFVLQHRRVAAQRNHAMRQPPGDERQPPNDPVPQNDASEGMQFVSTSWSQNFAASGGNTTPGKQPMYGLHWGYGK